jgi:ftsK/spoIIIE family protein
MEMLHTPDAAEITQAGRAYLQVGNNEVYELFQSAWSGADYQPDKDELGIEDHTIYRINDLGQYEVLNQDLSGLDLADEIKEVPTELDAIVENIQLLAENQEIAPLPQPWLPPLRERMTLDELEAVDFHKEWNKKPSDLELLIGMADIPQAQKQEPVSINLSKDGNILLYGSPGTGKTTFLQSTAMDLARKYSPKDVTLYLMDFGTNGLAPLSHLPHVADTLLLDQTEKVAKFVRIMERELNRRKKLLSDYGVGTIDLYRQASGQEEPTIVILLDSYEAMKEEPFEAELFKILMRISREGLSIGVHLIMTAGRQSNLRATLYANFKHQMTLKQNDVGEVRTILGSTPLAATMEDIKGRILMKRDEVDVVQLALPVAGISDAQVINNLRAEVARIQEAWTGETPQAIPMVPEELTEKDFYSRTDVLKLLSQEIIPLGLDIETVKPMGWNLKQGSFVYVANSEEQMRTMTKQFSIVSSKINSNVYIIAPKYNLIPDLDGYTIISDPENVKDFIEAVELLISERMEDQEKDLHTIIVIYDMSTLVGDLNHQLQDSLANIIKNGHKVGYPVFVETDNQLSKKIDYASKTVLRIKQGLVGLRLNDQYVIDVLSKPLREVALDEQIHYFVSHGQANKIKVLME